MLPLLAEYRVAVLLCQKLSWYDITAFNKATRETGISGVYFQASCKIAQSLLYQSLACVNQATTIVKHYQRSTFYHMRLFKCRAP